MNLIKPSRNEQLRVGNANHTEEKLNDNIIKSYIIEKIRQVICIHSLKKYHKQKCWLTLTKKTHIFHSMTNKIQMIHSPQHSVVIIMASYKQIFLN